MLQDHYAMAAVKAGGPDVLLRTELVLAPPGPGEVQIEHRAIGVNFIDCYFRSGLYPWPDPQRLIPGAEASGVIAAIGPGVTGLKEGDRVAYTLPNNAYASARNIASAHVVKLPDGIPFEVAASVMLKGLTARYLLKDSYVLHPGQKVLFHAAAGGVGLIAGQWMTALRVEPVGTAGGPDKCKYAVDELGFDACIDYKLHQDMYSLAKALKQECPNGIDGYFENVGGMVLDAVLLRMNAFGRIAVCGMIAGYDGAPLPLTNPALILVNRLKIEGFIVSEHMEVWPEALTELGTLVATGKLRPRETVAQGLAAAPEAFMGLLKGKNFGKQLVRL